MIFELEKGINSLKNSYKMETTSRLTMDWSNLQFKAKDLILFISYIVAGVFFITKITNSIDRQGEQIAEVQAQVLEMKNDNKGTSKETQVFWQSIQNQVNSNTTQIRLLEQRMAMFEQRNIK